MSWTTDDGQHECYVVAEFADGQRATSSSGGGVPDDQIIVATDSDDQGGGYRHQTRLAAEVVGWRVVCDCRTGVHDTWSVTNSWVSELLVRVPSAALEDVRAGRIYAADGDVIDVDFRDDVAALATDRWQHEHLDGPQALTRIRDARSRVAAAEQELDFAVRDARTAGESWEAIGRAAGITRQTAHQRWAGLDRARDRTAVAREG